MLRFFVLLEVFSKLVSGVSLGCRLSSDGTTHIAIGDRFHAVNKDGTAKWSVSTAMLGCGTWNQCDIKYCVGYDDTVYVANGQMPPVELLALDASDGSIRWQYGSSSDKQVVDLLLAKDGTVFMEKQAGRTNEFDVIDEHGELKFLLSKSSYWSSEAFLVSPETGILAKRDSGEVQSLSLMDGSVQWSQPLSGCAQMQFAEDGNVIVLLQHYLHAGDDYVYEQSLLRMSGVDGSILWNATMRSSSSEYANCADPNLAHLPPLQNLFVGKKDLYINGLLGEGDVCNLAMFDSETGAQLNLQPCLEDHRSWGASDPLCDWIFVPGSEEADVKEDVFIFASQYYDPEFRTFSETFVHALSGDGNVLWNVSTGSQRSIIGEEKTKLQQGPAGLVFSKTIASEEARFSSIRNGTMNWHLYDNSQSYSHRYWDNFPVAVAEDGTTFFEIHEHRSGAGLAEVASDGSEEWKFPNYSQLAAAGRFNTGCLDLPGGNTENGTPLWLWTCNGLENQAWTFADSGMIVYRADPSKCIDAGGMNSGDQLMIWDCNGSDQQLWGFDSDMRTIYPLHDASKCMNLPLDLPAPNGVAITVWDCNGNPNSNYNQQWIPPPSNTVGDNIASVVV